MSDLTVIAVAVVLSQTLSLDNIKTYWSNFLVKFCGRL